MKTFMIAAALAAAVAFGAPPAAEAAEVKFGIFFGVPHYSYRVGPDYVYRKGFGWYRRGHARDVISCGEAKSFVRNSGYRNVDAVECRGSTYTFKATRNGKRHVVYVNARSGGLWRS